MSLDNQELFPKIVNTVRASTALGARDIDFCRSLDSDVGNLIESNATEIVEMLNSMLVSIDSNSDSLELGKEKLEDYWKDFSNTMDTLFEKSDRSFDLLRRKGNTQQEDKKFQYLGDSADNDSNLSTRVSKPQLLFETPVDNSESSPFIPLITEKPHSIKPLSDCLQLLPREDGYPEHYPQPYEYEIDHQEYDSSVLLRSDIIPSQPWSDTSAVWVDTISAFESMVIDLKKYKEIAVDLEHHDYRSYYGIVCLMQISTRDTDYLIDTICLRKKLQPLNEVFTDPKILKVFHGAFMDIIWLQRDLGLYIVSLFDTYHASRAIGLPRFSLAYLLERFANFKTSKKYQLADWRIRPLSKAMTAYARSDTHFLLSIYDQLRNQLIEENKLAGVLYESRNVAKRRFEYIKYRPTLPTPSVYSSSEKLDAWRTLMYQYNIQPEKDILLKKLYEWRDIIARRDDESPRYVMPNQLLVSLVTYAPTDSIGVVSVSNLVTDHVRSNSKELANLIKKAAQLPSGSITDMDSVKREAAPNKLDVVEILTINQIQQIVSQFKGLLNKRKNQDQEEYKNTETNLLGDILSKDSAAIEYSKGQDTMISIEKLKVRALDASEKMKRFEKQQTHQISISVHSEDTAKNDKTSIEVVNENKTTKSGDLESEKQQHIENMDEIVSLREPRKNSKENRDRSAKKKTTNEMIDYTKSNKVLQVSSSTKMGKKRAFDPYSAKNDSAKAPKGPKKRKLTQKGKSASFKR